MYIIKNAFRNMKRAKGKNMLIGTIMVVIMISACITLSIHKAGDNLIESYKSSNPIEARFERNRGEMKERDTTTPTTTIKQMTIEDVKKYGTSKLVTSYYYTLEESVSSTDITAVVSDVSEDGKADVETVDSVGDSNKRPQVEMGDYRLTGYSDASFIAEIASGDKKITSGRLFTSDTKEKIAVISSELASQNDLEVGDTFTVTLPSDTEASVTLTVSAIYEDSSAIEDNSFMNLNAMNSRNQIYTNISTVESLTSSTSDDTHKSRGVQAVFYLESSNDIDAFAASAYKLGLDENYSISTNEEEALAALEPIQNLSNFSITFLIVIVIVGGIVIMVIHMMNIRDRKYEIGVLRAIGMSKFKVTLQLLCETCIISVIALILGTSIGIISSQPVTNMMLKQEIEKTKNEELTANENFGPGSFNRPGGNMRNKVMNRGNTDYITNLKVSVDFSLILTVMGCNILIVLFTSITASLCINQYEPNKILQNRN